MAVSCGTQIVKSLGDLAQLQGEIAKEYKEAGVNVRLNNNAFLVVTFINSPLNKNEPEERSRRAQETATFVKTHYRSMGTIEEVWVGFVRQETRYIVVNYTENLDMFGFDRNAQPLRMRDEYSSRMPENDLSPSANYSPRTKETDISISGFQLQGTLKQGLTLSPHFTVTGDATGGKLLPPPKSVSFDFASYGPKPKFPDETRVTLLSDEKVVFKTTQQFSTSRFDDGSSSEFLLMQVPYEAFRRMTAGERLVIRLGDKDFPLTAEQAALREMTRYIRNDK